MNEEAGLDSTKTKYVFLSQNRSLSPRHIYPCISAHESPTMGCAVVPPPAACELTTHLLLDDDDIVDDTIIGFHL